MITSEARFNLGDHLIVCGPSCGLEHCTCGELVTEGQKTCPRCLPVALKVMDYVLHQREHHIKIMTQVKRTR